MGEVIAFGQVKPELVEYKGQSISIEFVDGRWKWKWERFIKMRFGGTHATRERAIEMAKEQIDRVVKDGGGQG